jgi:hypothetical protein
MQESDELGLGHVRRAEGFCWCSRVRGARQICANKVAAALCWPTVVWRLGLGGCGGRDTGESVVIRIQDITDAVMIVSDEAVSNSSVGPRADAPIRPPTSPQRDGEMLQLFG